jgi:hypothetical protein
MNQQVIHTPQPVVSMIISFDNSRINAIIKESDYVSHVHGYCLHDFDLEFEEKYGDEDSENCVKMNQIE